MHAYSKGPRGLPGAAGKNLLTALDAVTAANAGEEVILVRMETSPEDIEGMYAANGILTSRGGMTHTQLLSQKAWNLLCGRMR